MAKLLARQPLVWVSVTYTYIQTYPTGNFRAIRVIRVMRVMRAMRATGISQLLIWLSAAYIERRETMRESERE